VRRWAFSSSSLTSYCTSAVQTPFHALFSLFFPDDCRICGEPLRLLSRIPLCSACLRPPERLAAEYFCVSCGTPFENAFPLDAEGRCALCRHGLRGFDAAYCYGSYEGRLREWIHLFKYGRIQTLANPLLELLAAVLPRTERIDAIVPVPLHWRKRWQRGFNQSELLARGIARKWGLPVVNALRRRRFTSAQAGLTNTERRKNVAAAFASLRPLEGQRILLIDDVLTTGSTAAACARVLRAAGAARIAVAAVARADRRLPAIPQSIPEENHNGE
jgi:ComF family protein